MPSRTTLPRPAPGTAKWWVIGTLGVAAGVALAVWFGVASTLGLASWKTTGYKVLDDQSVRVDLRAATGRRTDDDVHDPGPRPRLRDRGQHRHRLSPASRPAAAP